MRIPLLMLLILTGCGITPTDAPIGPFQAADTVIDLPQPRHDPNAPWDPGQVIAGEPEEMAREALAKYFRQPVLITAMQRVQGNQGWSHFYFQMGGRRYSGYLFRSPTANRVIIHDRFKPFPTRA